MTRTIGYGICGMGRMGVLHARYFAQKKNHYIPAAFCDFSLERAEKAAREYGGRAYCDYTEFLKNREMELVIIATRSMDHVRNAREALEAGKIVLLEKPIAVTSADYQEIRSLAKQYDGRLFFGQNHRFEPAHAMAYDLVRSGLIGRLHTVRISKAHPFAPRCDWQMLLSQGGGQLSVWGPHVIDQTLHFLNSPVKDVWSDLKSILTPGDADDHFRIMLRAENGALGEIEVSNAVAIPQPYCVLCGTRGAIRYDEAQKELELRYLDPQFRMPDLKAFPEAPTPDYAWTEEVRLPWVTETRKVTPEGSIVDLVEKALADFLWKAVNGIAPFPVTGEQALEVVRITEIVKKQNPQYHWAE